MNSQFRNSNFGFYLYAFIIFVILAATIFVVWYMTLGYKIGTYDADTRLGSVYIGGLTEEEVVPRIDDKISYWFNDETIVFELKYQGYSYEFDRNLFLFDIEASLLFVDMGSINELVVYYQGTDRSLVEQQITELPFLANVIENVDLELLINDVLNDAKLMKSFSSKNIEDYLIDLEQSIELIGVSSFNTPEGVQIDQIIEDIEEVYPDGRIIISEKELFDITGPFGEIMNDADMSVLSSAMLELILSTNFIVNEVHYEPNIDFAQYTIEDYPFYARNTHVNQIVDEGFSFYNPNESEYYFVINAVDDFSGTVSLYGLPFEYDIDVQINKTELGYITQGTQNVDLLQNGFNGVIIEVVRVTTDLDGNVVYNEVILFEFYPPIKEIIFEP
jgi:hypothetical protein